MKAMTAAQFVAYWLATDEDGHSLMSDNQESYYEHLAQYDSERALYGDAGPGQGLALREMREEMAKVNRQLARLTKI